MLRALGILVVSIGVTWLMVAFNMETSVETGGGLYVPDRVVNIDLMERRQNHLMMGVLVTFIGALMVIFGGSKGNTDTAVVARPSIKPPCDRDLSLDPYRLWLVERYDIKRNDVFDRFVYNSHTFATLDEALASAHADEMSFSVSSGWREAARREASEAEFAEASERNADIHKVGVISFAVLIPVIYLFIQTT